MHLTDEQKEHYDREGYIIVRNVLTQERVEAYKKRAAEIANGDIPPGGEKMLVKDVRVHRGKVEVDDPEKGLWKLLQPDWYDDVFKGYPETPDLLDPVEDIIGPDIKAFLTMMIYKPPGLEAEHPFHQDSSYFNFYPHDLIMGSWIALDPTREENGTLMIIPGSHKQDLIDHELLTGEDVNFGLLKTQGYEPGHPDEMAVELEPGDALFFHSRLLHRSGPNRTNGHRRVLTVHFCSAKCTIDGELLPQLKMRLVRGQEFAGCV